MKCYQKAKRMKYLIWNESLSSYKEKCRTLKYHLTIQHLKRYRGNLKIKEKIGWTLRIVSRTKEMRILPDSHPIIKKDKES